MKKIISILGGFLLVFAFAGSVSAAPNWDVTGTWALTFTCTSGCGGSWPHTMNVSFIDTTGDFSGTGYYNGNPAIIWTVAGNVDGDDIDFTVDYDSSSYAVVAEGTVATDGLSMTGTATGPGQTFTWTAVGTAIDIRDSDNDGVLDVDDKCLVTTPDSVGVVPFIELGVNRHVWYEGDNFTTLVPAGKGAKVPATSQFSLTDTYGCSCMQILNEMQEATGFDFEGHYKYGCSKSVIEDWIAGKYYIGPTLIEKVEVPANDADGVSGLNILETGKDYFLKAYGTATACWQTGCQITFDAEYSTSDGLIPWSTYANGVAAPYDTYGPDLLDLEVDGAFVDWGAYNVLHTYEIAYAGTGNLLSLLIYDLTGSYGNDSGSLFVDIIEDKWVDLW